MKAKPSLLIRCIMVTMSIGTKPAVIVRHIIVTLKWPRKILDRIAKPKEILAKLTGNLDFPLPYPSNVVSLSQLASDIDDVDKAQVDVKNGVIGAVQDRNVKLGIVKADLQSIKTMIQIKANSDPENAESMVKGTGFNYVYGNHGQKQQNGVKRTNVSGVYLLLAEGGGEHEWQLSPDKINIIYVQPTSTAHTLSPLLTLKQTYYLRSRKIGTKGVMFDWTPWFEFIVT